MNDSISPEITKITRRGVEDCIVREELEARMMKGDILRVKLGIDPTSPDLHIGHLLPLKKLAQFQKAGHQACMVVGTFTARIGDPTGKSEARKPITAQKIQENLKSYLEQASVVLDIEKTEITYNGDWLEQMSFADVLQVAGSFTVQQMLQRDMFQERIKQQREINLVEFMYPLMQGYDSVALRADVELGGTDQLFNNMAGRRIQEHFGQKPQAVITVPLLVGLDGEKKMSKSLGNHIAIHDSPRDVFGKTMSIADTMMENYFTLITDLSDAEIAELLAGHPRDAKVRLAREVTAFLKGEAAAEEAYQEFLSLFGSEKKAGTAPLDTPTLTVAAGEHGVIDLMEQAGLAGSRSEMRRLIEQGGVKLDGESVSAIDAVVNIASDKQLLQAGKRRFVWVVAG